MLNVKKNLTKILDYVSTVVHKTYTVSNLNHLSSVQVTINRCGKIGIVRLLAQNTNSAITVGNSALFTINDLPELASNSRGCGYTASVALIADITTGGNVTIRVTAAQWGANSQTEIYIPVIFK